MQGWFRGINALKRIYVDEIFNMDYFVLQFDNLSTMKKLVRNFNDDSETGATMTPIVYVRPNTKSKHYSPHNRCRGQSELLFKVIDLDGSDEHTKSAKDAVLALTHNDVIQFLHVQPSPNELHFWVNSFAHANKFLEIWSIVIGESVCRLGPAKFSMHQFRNRNKFVGRSTTASKFTDAQIHSNLANIGVKDIYRRQSEDGSIDVFAVFDSEISYKNAVTKSVWMHDTNLKFSPQTQMLPTKQSSSKNNYNKNKRPSRSPSRSPQIKISDNTFAVLNNINDLEDNVATATNCIPLGHRGSISNRVISPDENSPQHS